MLGEFYVCTFPVQMIFAAYGAFSSMYSLFMSHNSNLIQGIRPERDVLFSPAN